MTRPRMPLSRPSRAVAALVALAGGAVALAAPASAEPAPEIPRGMYQTVSDVLTPSNPAFWNPTVPGTRVLTPLAPGTEVACTAGFVPPISCASIDRSATRTPQRQLEHLDVPTLGGPPVQLWVDRPQWGDGSLAQRAQELTALLPR